MSKAEILAAVSKLSPGERSEVLERLWQLEEEEAIRRGPTEEDKHLLDRELADYEADSTTTSWKVAEARLRQPK